MHRYTAWNGPMPTAAAQQSVTTGTTIKTMMQLALPSTRMCQVISWGFSLSGVPNGTIELLSGDVADTVTAYVASGIQPIDPNAPASLMQLGTALSGYSASAQGAMTAVRVHDSQLVTNTAGENELNYSYQFMPDERPMVGVSKFLKVRATTGTAVTMQCFICWDE
jgi:hypothetical protein